MAIDGHKLPLSCTSRQNKTPMSAAQMIYQRRQRCPPCSRPKMMLLMNGPVSARRIRRKQNSSAKAERAASQMLAGMGISLNKGRSRTSRTHSAVLDPRRMQKFRTELDKSEITAPSIKAPSAKSISFSEEGRCRGCRCRR